MLLSSILLLVACSAPSQGHTQARLVSLTVSDGAIATGGAITLRATLGQPVIGPAAVNQHNASFGFWYATVNSSIPTTIDDQPMDLPHRVHLEQNYPNPFNPMTTIDYDLAAPALVKLKVYDMLGREVATLVDRHQVAGRHSATWDGRSGTGGLVSSGTYLYQIKAGTQAMVKKMILVK